MVSFKYEILIETNNREMIKRIKRKIYKLFHPPIGEILMLHRVVTERSLLEDNCLMEITPEYLESIILDYQNRNYELISMDQLYERIQLKKKSKRKFVCFTLDDGYVDNYSIAYPVFKKNNCPFTIYLTTDFPNGKALLWWYVLEDILLKNDKIRLGDGTEYSCETIELKNQTFRTIREKVFSMQNENMSVILTELFSPYQYSFADTLKKNSLNWGQIIELSKDPICTIASHSVSHAALDKLTDENIEIELILSKNNIEDVICKPVEHFAYPYGRFNENVMQLVDKTGYKTAVSANGGIIRTLKSIYSINRRIHINNVGE